MSNHITAAFCFVLEPSELSMSQIIPDSALGLSMLKVGILTLK